MTAAEILRKAATLPWTQFAFARDARGKGLADEFDRNAVRWCASGALRVACPEADYNTYITAKRALSRCMGMPVVTFNDGHGRTADEVRAKMIEAAELLERGNG